MTRRGPMACVLAVVLIGGCAKPSARRPSTPSPPAAAASPSPASTPSPTTSPSAAAAAPTPSPQRRPAPRPTAAPAPAGTADPCAVGPQAPPPPSIPAAFPTALAAAPDGRLFIGERGGTIRLWQDGSARVFATVPTVTKEPGGRYSERGLLGLALSPGFAQDRFVYVLYSNTDRAHQDVVRWTDCAGQGRDATLVIRLPSGDDCCHKGGRLRFGPDGQLYVTVGDQHVAGAAQDPGDVRGKVLRYNADGSVPADNPFGAGNPVWAFGFRNPFGLAVSPTGQVAVTDNGPTGDAGSPRSGYDTVAAGVGPGAGYQWPVCYGYSHPIGSSSCNGRQEPDWSSEETAVVPTGAAFIDDGGPAAYAGRLVFCTVNAGMQVLTPGTPHATVAPGPSGCRLDVIQAPDHSVFYADSSHVRREPGRD